MSPTIFFDETGASGRLVSSKKSAGNAIGLTEDLVITVENGEVNREE